MSRSIKTGTGTMGIGKKSALELRKLLEATLVDLAAHKAALTTLRNDVVNVQTTANALVTDVANLRAQELAIVVDLGNVRANTGSANNTSVVTAVNAAAATATAATVSANNAATLTLLA